MVSFYVPNSRYYNLVPRSRTEGDATVVTFTPRRIIPAMERYQPLDRYRCIVGDRIDGVAASSFGDAEQYWRICDANGDADPGAACLPVGRLLLVPLPLEIADNGNA